MRVEELYKNGFPRFFETSYLSTTKASQAKRKADVLCDTKDSSTVASLRTREGALRLQAQNLLRFLGISGSMRERAWSLETFGKIHRNFNTGSDSPEKLFHGGNFREMLWNTISDSIMLVAQRNRGGTSAGSFAFILRFQNTLPLEQSTSTTLIEESLQNHPNNFLQLETGEYIWWPSRLANLCEKLLPLDGTPIRIETLMQKLEEKRSSSPGLIPSEELARPNLFAALSNKKKFLFHSLSSSRTSEVGRAIVNSDHKHLTESFKKLNKLTIVLEVANGKPAADANGQTTVAQAGVKNHKLTDDRNVKFAVAVREARQVRNMTQRQFAKATGLSRSRIQAIERGNIPGLSAARTLLSSLTPDESHDLQQIYLQETGISEFPEARKRTALGEVVRKIRNDLKITQKELATKVGLSPWAVGQIEEGRTQAPLPKTISNFNSQFPKHSLLLQRAYLEDCLRQGNSCHHESKSASSS